MAKDEVVVEYSDNWKAVLKARQRNIDQISLKTEKLQKKPLEDAYVRFQELTDQDIEIDELVEFLKHNPLGRSPHNPNEARRLRANHPRHVRATNWKQQTCRIKGCNEPPVPSYSCCDKCLKFHKLGPYINRPGRVDYDEIDSTPKKRPTPQGSIFDGGPIPREYIWPVANPRGIKLP